MTIEIDEVRVALALNKVIITIHAEERLRKRHITKREIVECIVKGEIIEQYEQDYPFASCLIFALVVNKRPIHTVVALDENEGNIHIITAYEVDQEQWIDNKVRRDKNDL
ncbi:MAG: DUF4258 domain-containing protein [Sarcina sp.]